MLTRELVWLLKYIILLYKKTNNWNQFYLQEPNFLSLKRIIFESLSSINNTIYSATKIEQKNNTTVKIAMNRLANIVERKK